MMLIKKCFVVLVMCCAINASSSAIASSLLPFSFYGGGSVFVDANGDGILTGPSQSVFTGSATLTVLGPGGNNTSAQILGTTSPLPSVTASTSNGVAGRTTYDSVQNNLDYWIMVVGPGSALNVPLVVNGNVHCFPRPAATRAPKRFLPSTTIR